VISGLYRPTAGRLLFKGEDLARLPAYAITARGIARTFQNIRVFPNLTVLEAMPQDAQSATAFPFPFVGPW
jgi:branched-chain amino acid transport system ATP-binding protein